MLFFVSSDVIEGINVVFLFVIRIIDLRFTELLSDKLIQVTHDLCINLYFDAILFLKAFQMSILTALNALVLLHSFAIWFFPALKASYFIMTNMVAFHAKDDILFSAITSLMSDFVALEAHFFIAVE